MQFRASVNVKEHLGEFGMQNSIMNMTEHLHLENLALNLSFSGAVTISKSCHLPQSQFSHLENGVKLHHAFFLYRVLNLQGQHGYKSGFNTPVTPENHLLKFLFKL